MCLYITVLYRESTFHFGWCCSRYCTTSLWLLALAILRAVFPNCRDKYRHPLDVRQINMHEDTSHYYDWKTEENSLVVPIPL